MGADVRREVVFMSFLNYTNDACTSNLGTGKNSKKLCLREEGCDLGAGGCRLMQVVKR
jgi:hypothetical protein